MGHVCAAIRARSAYLAEPTDALLGAERRRSKENHQSWFARGAFVVLGGARVAMMETANVGDGDDPTAGQWLNRSRERRVAVEREMTAGLVVIAKIAS